MRDVQRRDVNEEPRSDVVSSGMPNLETHAKRNVAFQEEDVASTMGTASGPAGRAIDDGEDISVAF